MFNNFFWWFGIVLFSTALTLFVSGMVYDLCSHIKESLKNKSVN